MMFLKAFTIGFALTMGFEAALGFCMVIGALCKGENNNGKN